MTGTTTSVDLPRSPRISATKVEARTTSSVVTPKILYFFVRNPYADAQSHVCDTDAEW